MWFKVDDKLHVHRKTRRLLNSHTSKRLDAAPMGLWVIAGAWAGQNAPGEGWVPEYELDRWDDDWQELVARLVTADFWWPESRGGEPGYSFVNWDEYKPSAGAHDDGQRGNHIRWHVQRKMVSPTCEFCPTEPGDSPEPPPDADDSSPRNRPDIAPSDRPESGHLSGGIANPTRTRPDTNPNPTRFEGAETEPVENVRELAVMSSTAEAAKSRKGIRIPDNWNPARNPANLKAEEGHDPQWLELELSRFRDYWTAQPGQKGVKAGAEGWESTWRNWIRKAAEYAPKTPQATMGNVDWRTA